MSEEIFVPVLWDHVQQANDYRVALGEDHPLVTHCPVALALRAHFPKACSIHVATEYAQIDEEIFSLDHETIQEIERWTIDGEFYPHIMLLIKEKV